MINSLTQCFNINYRLDNLISFIFIGEMGLKISILGPQRYFKNLLNFFDCLVTNMAIIDLCKYITKVIINTSNLSPIFYKYRVLRIFRLLRELSFMKVII